MIDFSKQVILIAGGTGGLGRAVSLAFLEAGATVVVTYRKQSELDALRSEAAAANGLRLDGRVVDVTDEAHVTTLVEEIFTRHGKLGVLVNTVGGYTGGEKLWEMNPAALEKMLDVNLRSVFVLSRAAARRMVTQGHGAIVNVLSKAAVDHAAGQAAYAASKAAALVICDSLAADLQSTGVRANAILPSIIDTEANRRAMPKADFAKWPKPGEIAPVILFLCSDDSRIVHGAAVPVYGNR